SSLGVGPAAVAPRRGVPLGERPAGPPRDWRQRGRSAGWFLLHLVAGGIVGVASTFGIPLAFVMFAAPFRDPGGHESIPGLGYPGGGGWGDAWLPLAGLLGIVVPLLLAAGLGALLARWAP